jgi:acetylornithine deacetylase/succinyl-diaminopimelate desuccinylase-like protein
MPDPAADEGAAIPAGDARPPVVALIRDLILGSRVSAAAAGLGVPLRTIRDPAKLAGAAGDRLIVDLNEPGAIEAAVAWRAAGEGRRAVGFVSHVDVATVGGRGKRASIR